MLTLGSLFSGVGAMDYGIERTGGFKTIWQSEIDEYASAVLKKHWPDVPNLGDITKIDWSKVEKPDVVVGGFPCTDVSVAGKGKGVKDGKYSGLWKEYARCIRYLRPNYLLVENVPMLAKRGLDIVTGDITSLGYDSEWGIISAASIGAPHKRERIFIIAHSRSSRFSTGGDNWEGRPILPTEIRASSQDSAKWSGWKPGVNQDVKVNTPNNDVGSQQENQLQTRGQGTSSNLDGIGHIHRKPEEQPTETRKPALGEPITGFPFGGKPTNQRETQPSPNTPGEFVQFRFKPKIRQFEEFSPFASARTVQDLQNRPDLPQPLIRRENDGSSIGVDRTNRRGIEERYIASKGRTDRIKCLGNAVVPAFAQVVAEIILEMERERNG